MIYITILHEKYLKSEAEWRLVIEKTVRKQITQNCDS